MVRVDPISESSRWKNARCEEKRGGLLKDFYLQSVCFFFNFHCVTAIPDFSSHWTGLIEIIILNFQEVEREERSGEYRLLIACVVAHQKRLLQCTFTLSTALKWKHQSAHDFNGFHRINKRF